MYNYPAWKNIVRLRPKHVHTVCALSNKIRSCHSIAGVRSKCNQQVGSNTHDPQFVFGLIGLIVHDSIRFPSEAAAM